MGLLLLVVILAFGAAVTALASFLPWWGTLAVLAAVAVGAYLVVPKMVEAGIKKGAKQLFEAKSRVLRGANVTVTEVVVVPRPTPPDGEAADDGADDEDADAEEIHRYVRVDFSVRPADVTGTPMQFFDPDEIRLVPAGKRVDFDSMADGDGDESPEASVAHGEIWHEGAFVRDYEKMDAEARLRLTFAVPRALPPDVQLVYYFESLATLRLPA